MCPKTRETSSRRSPARSACPESDSADALRLELCHRVYNLPRWAGEHGPFGTFCVGPHLELVSYLAGKLAEARDLSDETVTLCRSMGALHDVGEGREP